MATAKSFLDLPAELRNTIYEATLPTEKRLRIEDGRIRQDPLLRISKQVRKEYETYHKQLVETADIFSAEIVDWDFRHVAHFFDTLRLSRLENIRRVDILIVLTTPAIEIDHSRPAQDWFNIYHRQTKPYHMTERYGLELDIRYAVCVQWQAATVDQIGYLASHIERLFRESYGQARPHVGGVQLRDAILAERCRRARESHEAWEERCRRTRLQYNT